MSATIRQIVDAALTVVGEVAGPGVQMYSEPRMFADAVRGFNMMHKKFAWEQYLEWFTLTLNGTTGLATTNDLQVVKDFEDFIAIHIGGSPTPLQMRSKKSNPRITSLTGSTLLGWGSLSALNPLYGTKKLQFYPVTATGTVDVLAKVYPLIPPAIAFDWNQIFYLDEDLLAYATAFMTLSGDDLNAGAADTVKNLMEMRYRDIIAALAKHAIPIGGSGTDIPRTWHEYPY